MYILVTVAANDIYFAMPGTFFQGEAEAKGLSPSFSGFYLGATGVLAFLSPPVASYILQFANLNDVQRLMGGFMVLVTVPQGLAVLCTSASSFAAVTLVLRVFEGIPYSLIELCAMTYLLRLFQLKKKQSN